MKKLLTGILALLTCFGAGMAVACGDDNGNKTPSGLAAAKDVLYSTYVNKDVEGRYDYEVLNSTAYDGVLYTVTWSVDVGSEHVVLEAGSQNKTLVNVNENSAEAVPYVLTATISDDKGNSVQVSFNRTLLAVPALVPEAITAAPVEGKAYKYYVYQSTKQLELYFSGMMDGYYYQTTENYEEAVDIYAEYVDGSTTDFYLYFNHTTDGKQYLGVQLSSDGAHDNIVYTSTPVSSFKWDETLGTVTTHLEVNKEGKASDYYLGNYSTHVTISASKTSYAGGNGNNVGHLVEMIDKNNIPADKKIATVKDNLSVQADHKMNKTLELATGDERYPDVTISWAVAENSHAVLEDNALTLTIPAEAATVTLTATIACGEESDTKEFTLNLGPAIVLGENPTATEIVNAAFQLATGEQLEGSFTLEGVITKVNTEYNTDYSNVTVTIKVEDKAIECYRLKGDGADVIAVGDTINVTGTIKNYNGKVEFDSGCTLNSYVKGENGGNTDDPVVTPPVDAESITAPVAETAYTMYIEQNGLSKTLYLTGAMGGNNNNFFAMSENASDAVDIYAEVVDGGYKFYFLGSDDAKSYITLTEYADGNYFKASVSFSADGTVFQYNAAGCWTAELANDTFFLGTYGTYNTTSASSDYYMKNLGTEQFPLLICADVNTGSGDNTDTPVVTPPAEEITTIAGALAGSVGSTATFSGTVSGIYEQWNTQYNNMAFYVTDGTDTILVYRAGTKVVVGDVVSVSGTIAVYNNVNQIAQGATVTITEKHVCSTFTEADCLNAAKCTVCGAPNGEALGHEDENSDNLCDNCEADLSIATTIVTYDLANSTGAHITADGKYTVDDTISITLSSCSWRTEGQIRVYGNKTGNDYIIIESTKKIASITFNVGNNSSPVIVAWGSDSSTFANETNLTVSSTYTDYTVQNPDTEAYTYVKFTNMGAQVRIESITITFID